ncbi:MAG: hypothetical protein AB1696_11570 [Planctomycetota bacterium]
MIAFIADDADATRLVAKIDEIVKAHQASGLRGFVVFAAGPKKKAEMEKMAAEHGISVPMVLPKDLDQTLNLYKINPKAKSTVLVTKANQVQFNAVDVASETFGGVEEAVKRVLGQ